MPKKNTQPIIALEFHFEVNLGENILIMDNYEALKREILNELDLINEDEVDVDLSLTGEKALWQSVIMQAVIDILSKSKRTSDIVEQKISSSWFDMNDRNFLFVCEMASLEPNFLVKNVKRLIVNQLKERKDKSNLSTLLKKYNTDKSTTNSRLEL